MKSYGQRLKTLIFAFLFTLCLVDGLINDEVVQVAGTQGRSITLRCTSAMESTSPPKHVEWVDMVHNSSPEPQRIFTTKRNPQKSIDLTHPNAENYRVDADFSLTILDLSTQKDPGQYTCRTTWEGGDRKNSNYYLSVASMPTCSGRTDVVEGEGEIELECRMLFSGTQPVLQWYHGDELLHSDDDFDVGTALKRLRVRANHRHDKSKYTCKISLGDMKESCFLTMNVSYLVREIKITPDKKKIRVGDEVECSARGNPAPEVTIHPEGAEGVGHRGKTLLIDEAWAGREIEVRCSASNRVADKLETLTATKSYHVTEKPKHVNKSMNDARETKDEHSSKNGDTQQVVGSENNTSSRHTTFSRSLAALSLSLAYISFVANSI